MFLIGESKIEFVIKGKDFDREFMFCFYVFIRVFILGWVGEVE